MYVHIRFVVCTYRSINQSTHRFLIHFLTFLNLKARLLRLSGYRARFLEQPSSGCRETASTRLGTGQDGRFRTSRPLDATAQLQRQQHRPHLTTALQRRLPFVSGDQQLSATSTAKQWPRWSVGHPGGTRRRR